MTTETYSILITGGAGYLGSVMVPALLSAGHKVTVLDSFMFEQMPFSHECLNPNFSLVRGDAAEKSVLEHLVKSADIVIPLAALVGAPMCDRDPANAVRINRDAISVLVSLMSPDQRILAPISNSGYGVGESGDFCTEDSPLNPISLYGRTKVEAEEILLERGNAISFRLATVFGMAPRMRLDLLVNDFTYRAYRDRTIVLFEADFKRNYIHIRDVARAFLHGLVNFDEMNGQAFNVGLEDANLSKRELCEVIQKHVPGFVFLEAPVGEDPDKRDYIVSNQKILNTGFSPAYSLDDGIQELLKGFVMFKNTPFGNV